MNWNKTLKADGFVIKLRDKGMCKLQKIQFSVVAEYQYLCKSNQKYLGSISKIEKDLIELRKELNLMLNQ